jgi:hypothetical protein
LCMDSDLSFRQDPAARRRVSSEKIKASVNRYNTDNRS